MQKLELRDVIRAAGVAIGLAAALFAAALSGNIPVDQLMTPMALAIMLSVGIAASIFDLVYALKRPDRLAIARGERMPDATEVKAFQSRALHALNVVMIRQLAVAAVIMAAIVWTAMSWR